MESRTRVQTSELTALLIAPDRALAEQFSGVTSKTKAFQILSDLKSYPALHTLEIRLRQFRPDCLLLDLGSDPEAAAAIISLVVALDPPVQVVGLSQLNDPDVLLRSFRLGASEFLHAPFDTDAQLEAAFRLQRLRLPESAVNSEPGTVVVFSSAKPGAGASTLAVQAALSLRSKTGKRVLLADFDLLGGTVGFDVRFKPEHLSGPEYSLIDALRSANELSYSLWSGLVSDLDGVDVLSAPSNPYCGPIDSGRINTVIEFARMNYDWVCIDLPVIFQRLSLTVLSSADRAMLISTPELPSLHLTRKAVQLLDRLGFPKDRAQILVNRVSGRGDLSLSDMEKLFDCPVYAQFPNDYLSLNRAVARGQRLDSASELGRSFDEFAGKLSGLASHHGAKAALAYSAPRISS